MTQSRAWDVKLQAELAQSSFEKRETWMKSVSYFAGTVASRTRESACNSNSSNNEIEKGTNKK